MSQWCVSGLVKMVTGGDRRRDGLRGEPLVTQCHRARGSAFDWNDDAGGEPKLWRVGTHGWSDMEDRHRMAGAICA